MASSIPCIIFITRLAKELLPHSVSSDYANRAIDEPFSGFHLGNLVLELFPSSICTRTWSFSCQEFLRLFPDQFPVRNLRIAGNDLFLFVLRTVCIQVFVNRFGRENLQSAKLIASR